MFYSITDYINYTIIDLIISSFRNTNGVFDNQTFWTAVGSIGTILAFIFTWKSILNQNKENMKARKFETEKEIALKRQEKIYEINKIELDKLNPTVIYNLFSKEKKDINNLRNEILSIKISQQNTLYRVLWNFQAEEYNKIMNENPFNYRSNIQNLIEFNLKYLDKYINLLELYENGKLLDVLKETKSKAYETRMISTNKYQQNECEAIMQQAQKSISEIKTLISEEEYQTEFNKIINEYSKDAQSLYDKAYISTKMYIEQREEKIKNRLVEEENRK